MGALYDDDVMCQSVSCIYEPVIDASTWQIEWYRNTAQMFKQQDGHHAKPAMAFQHIPIPEFMELWNYHMTYGTLQDEGTIWHLIHEYRCTDSCH